MVQTAEVVIRRLEATELRSLESSMPSQFHQQRLQIQTREEADYLIAWRGSEAVGHLLLRWQGPLPRPLEDRAAGIPYIEALVVKEQVRARGIGSRLMAAAEEKVIGRGISSAGLAVAVENWPAMAFYARRGYELTGFDPFDVSWSYVDHDGALNVEEERCVYLVKTFA
jgi:ribosomal protein S18 acetylase RimI-like enzyme